VQCMLQGCLCPAPRTRRWLAHERRGGMRVRGVATCGCERPRSAAVRTSRPNTRTTARALTAQKRAKDGVIRLVSTHTGIPTSDGWAAEALTEDHRPSVGPQWSPAVATVPVRSDRLPRVPVAGRSEEQSQQPAGGCHKHVSIRTMLWPLRCVLHVVWCTPIP
jgi:hypothetical protein